MKINRLLTNICTKDLHLSKAFYTSLFSLDIAYDSDWFVHLVSDDNTLELGLISQDHDIVPEQVRNAPNGFYLTFVVDDVHTCFQLCQTLSYNIIQPPEDTNYGQTRMLVKAPEGTICDISSLT